MTCGPILKARPTAISAAAVLTYLVASSVAPSATGAKPVCVAKGPEVRGSPGARGCPDRREHLLHHDDVDGRDASPRCASAKAALATNLPDKPAPARTPASLERAVRVLVHRRNGRDDRRSQTRGVRALHQERCDGQERTALQLGGRRSQAGSLGHTTPSAAPTRSRVSRPPPPRYAQVCLCAETKMLAVDQTEDALPAEARSARSRLHPDRG